MIVYIDHGLAQLKELDDLNSFKVVTMAAAPSSALSSALDGIGRLDGAAAWVSIDWLRGQASGQSAQWFERFERMLAYAGSKGWLDEAGQAVRGHVEALS